MKKYIPNILTISRLLMLPLMLFLAFKQKIFGLLVVGAIVFLTDALDGFLARKWHATSDFGAFLDVVADKVTAIGLLLFLVFNRQVYMYIFILELLIAFFNLYVYQRMRIVNSLLIGKLKTWVIFVTILVGFASILWPNVMVLVNILAIVTLLFQALTLLSYVLFYVRLKKNSKDVFGDYVEFYNIIEPFVVHQEFIKRKSYPHHINESVYEHTLRVSYDCFKIAKRLKLDYKSLTIAGLLHDFYLEPWQYNKEKKPFLQMHAFTHAHEAVLNAKKYYGKRITPKIMSIMETHMFPVNKKIPRSREAWLLTLIDKADSIDFVLHPIMLYKIFKNSDD